MPNLVKSAGILDYYSDSSSNFAHTWNSIVQPVVKTASMRLEKSAFVGGLSAREVLPAIQASLPYRMAGKVGNPLEWALGVHSGLEGWERGAPTGQGIENVVGDVGKTMLGLKFFTGASHPTSKLVGKHLAGKGHGLKTPGGFTKAKALFKGISPEAEMAATLRENPHALGGFMPIAKRTLVADAAVGGLADHAGQNVGEHLLNPIRDYREQVQNTKALAGFLNKQGPDVTNL